MANLAQLLCGPVGELRGCDENLERMRGALEAWGFEVLAPPEAGRDAMLGALEALVARVAVGDAVAIYYTGHGGLGRFRTPSGVSRLHRYLATGDATHGRSNFRGVLDEELQHVLDRLCVRSDNVTVMLECCYAGGMLDARRPRGRDDSTIWPREFEGPSPSVPARLLPLRSPPIIVAATQEGGKAYESDERPHVGLFTRELATALLRARERPTSWQQLVLEVRQGMRSDLGSLRQLPHVIGLDTLAVLGRREHGEGRWHEVIAAPGGAWLRAGALHGIEAGDELELADARGDVCGRVRVGVVELDRAWLAAGRQGAMARLVAKREGLGVALVPGDTPGCAALREAIERSPWLRMAPLGDAAVEVVVTEGRMLVREREAGLEWRLAPEQVVDALAALAHRAVFLVACRRIEPPPPPITIEVCVDGRPLPSDARLSVGSRLEFTVTHEGGPMAETLHLAIVWEHADGQLELVAPGRPAGLDLFSETRDDHAPLAGLELELGARTGVGRHAIYSLVSRRPLLLSLSHATSRSLSSDSADVWLQRVTFELVVGGEA